MSLTDLLCLSGLKKSAVWRKSEDGIFFYKFLLYDILFIITQQFIKTNRHIEWRI